MGCTAVAGRPARKGGTSGKEAAELAKSDLDKALREKKQEIKAKLKKGGNRVEGSTSEA